MDSDSTFGDVGSPVNQPGFDHYDHLINTCPSYGVTPVITLAHGDQLLHLQFNATTFPKAFLYQAQQVMSRFLDRVPIWVTINEPNINFNHYIDNNNILVAHAKVYHFYKEELGGTGRITLMFANNINVPLDPTNSSDVEAALRYQEFILGIEANPLSLDENYPSSVLSITGINLIGLSPVNLSYINNTIDFFSFDSYITQFATAPPDDIKACAANLSGPLYLTYVFTTNVRGNGWINGDESYAYAYLSPQYFRQHLGYVWNTFRLSGIAITEFGFNSLREYAGCEKI